MVKYGALSGLVGLIMFGVGINCFDVLGGGC